MPLSLKKKLATVLSILVWFWWINPLPELSILLALMTGGSVSLATLNWTNIQISLLMLVVTYHPVNWFMETYITPKLVGWSGS